MWAELFKWKIKFRKIQVCHSQGLARREGTMTMLRTEAQKDPEWTAVGGRCLRNIFGLWWRDVTDLSLPAKKEPPAEHSNHLSALPSAKLTRRQKVQGKVEKGRPGGTIGKYTARNTYHKQKISLSITASNNPCPLEHTADVFLSQQLYWATGMSFRVAAAKSHQSSLILWDPMDSSPPGSPVHGIL